MYLSIPLLEMAKASCTSLRTIDNSPHWKSRDQGLVVGGKTTTSQICKPETFSEQSRKFEAQKLTAKNTQGIVLQTDDKNRPRIPRADYKIVETANTASCFLAPRSQFVFPSESARTSSAILAPSSLMLGNSSTSPTATPDWSTIQRVMFSLTSESTP